MTHLPEGLHQLRIPTGLPVGDVNCYLIEGNPLTLIDTGLKSEESLASLTNSLEDIGHRLGDIEQILLTHGHVDHMGLATTIMRASEREGSHKTRVYIHEGDAKRVTDYVKYMVERADAYLRVAQESGSIKENAPFPPASILINYFKKMGESVPDVIPIKDSVQFKTGIGALEAVWTPGHSYGSTCYVSHDHRLILSGDHILSDISSNPSLDFESFDGIPMLAYFDSLRKIRRFDGYQVLPGHRDILTSLSRRIDELLQDYENKFIRAREALGPSPMSQYHLSRVLYGDYDFSQMILALVETHDILRILEMRGQARLERVDDIVMARAARK